MKSRNCRKSFCGGGPTILCSFNLTTMARASPRRLFHAMTCQVLISSRITTWFGRIKELSLKGKWQDVFIHYLEMKRAGVRFSDPEVFPPILKACLTLSFRHGKSVHACLLKQGLDSFTSIGNSVMDFYMKSWALDSALRVFYCMKIIDAVSWNVVIHGHLDHGVFEKGLCLFMQARVAGFKPNDAAVVLAIQASRSLKATHEGTKIHGYVTQTGFWCVSSIQNALLSLYVGIEMESAQKLFDEMTDRDVISWSVMIGGYVLTGIPEIAFRMFLEMVSMHDVEIDGQVMVSVIKACSSLEELEIGRMVHGFIICGGFDCDVFIRNSLVDLYSKCNDVESALKVFNEMPRRNVVSWNSLLSAFISHEKYSEALMLVGSMGKARIEADEVTLVNLLQACKRFVNTSLMKSIHSVIMRRGYEFNQQVMNSLLDAYAKSDSILLAWKLFNQMKTRDTVTWSTMIAGFSYCGMPDEAIAIYGRMSQARHQPNAITILNLLEACSASAELSRSRWAHGVAIRRGFAADATVGTAILDMYSKGGAIETSKRVFDQIPHKNVVSWSAMVAACGMNGLPLDALALLVEMKGRGVRPNHITTLSALSACSHGGLVAEGLSLFEELVRDGDVTELKSEHYSCVVDLLGRAGKLDAAIGLIQKMQTDGLKPSASALGALLSSCRSHENSNLGTGAIPCILKLEPLCSTGYLLASSMHAAEGSWHKAARMRQLVEEMGLSTVAGYSLITVNDLACKFVAGEKHHPLSDEIYLVTHRLHWCMMMEN